MVQGASDSQGASEKTELSSELGLMGWGAEFATCFLTRFSLVLVLPQSPVMLSLKRNAELNFKCKFLRLVLAI